MHGPAQAELARRGYDGSGHRARQIEASWLAGYDLLVAMDRKNLASLRRMAPAQDAPRIALLRSFDPALAKDDRRRLKVLYWGSTVAMGPSFLLILYSLIVLRRNIGDSDALAYCMMAMALFPFRNPITDATGCLGGIAIHICTWSGIRWPSMIWHSFCRASSWKIVPS